MDIADISFDNAREYCDRNGYGLVPEILDSPYNGFEKLRSALQIFDAGADVVWVMDADTLITNHTIKLERYLSNGYSFYITKDYNGVNAGSFVIKKSKWSISFIEWLLMCEGKEKMYCEQDAINRYMTLFPRETKNHICILPHPSINSYLYENYPELPMQSHENGQWEIGDFVLHLPGIGLSKRLEILKNTKVIK